MKLKEAIERIDKEYYMKENGELLTQTTSPEAIYKGLEMLSVHEGCKVLELGTGFGYSTSLLANLVGESGTVVSIDIDPVLIERAKGKLSNILMCNVLLGMVEKVYPN